MRETKLMRIAKLQVALGSKDTRRTESAVETATGATLNFGNNMRKLLNQIVVRQEWLRKVAACARI